MKKFFTYILLLFAIAGFAEHTTCADYKLDTIHSDGGVISILKVDSCTWNITATPTNGYKFAYWKNLFGTIDFDSFFVLEIDTNVQNYLYEANFVRDNAFIYKWLDDSIIIRTDTTDLLSSCDSAGWSYTVVNSYIRLADEDERITKLDWGIWKADVTELINHNNYAGLPLHMVINNACGKPSAVIDTIIPVVVHGTMDAHDIDFHSDVPHCDLQVLEDAILYVDSDIVVNGTLDIHEGGKVIINEGHTLEAQNIILRGDGIRKKWGQLLINGAAYGPNKNDSVLMYYDYILTLNYWQPLSLPDTISPNDITSSITRQPAIFRNMFYNTLTRNTGASGWEVHNDDSLIMGHGYITTAQPNRWNGLYQKTDILKYPIRIKLSNEQTDRQISVYGSTDPNIKVNDKNWNLIGNPYLSDYIVDDIGVIKMGDAYGGHTEVRYITYTTDNFMTYVQRPLIGDTLKSFNVYFIQTIDNGDIIFKKKNLAHNPAPAHKHIKNEHQFGITLSQNGTIEHIGLLYGDFSTDYEINADLSKMFGFGNQMSAYSLLNNDPLAFQALPLENITNAVPLGYRNANISNMTFKYDFERYSDSELNAVWLFDIVNNSYTDLLTNAYTFTPNATNEDNRFYISFELKSNVTTSVDNVTFDFEDMHFDILGRRTYLLENGVYIIKNKNGKYIKVIR